MNTDGNTQEPVEASRAFGERLKALRTKEGLTQPELAALLNVKRQTIASWEQGATTPELRSLFLLKTNLRQEFGSDLDLGELLGGRSQVEAGKPVDLVIRLLQRISSMGIEDVHATRAEALSAFIPHLEREQRSICVVSSSFLGVTRVAPPRVGDILKEKAATLKHNFKVLLTHPARCDFREKQEGRTGGSIEKEILESVETLRAWGVPEDSIRCYRGTPTIFLLFTPTRMLANPYTYEAEAFKTVTFELSIAKDGVASSGIYEQYFLHHFSRPWSGPNSECAKDIPQFARRDSEHPPATSTAKKR